MAAGSVAEEQEFVQDEEAGGKKANRGSDGVKIDILGEQAAGAWQRGGATHGRADPEADGGRGEFLAEALGRAGHQARENHREPKARESERDGRGLRKGVPGEEGCPEERGDEAEPDQEVDANAVD